MNIPDWLWQELMADVIWTGIAVSAAWVWNRRKEIADKLGLSPEDIVINLQPLTLRTEAQPITLSGQAMSSSRSSSSASGTLTVNKNVDPSWNVEAPTPSLARRLEELASWYLHVS
jgi:hypothetical protein